MIQGLLEATSVSSGVIHCRNKSTKEKNRKSEMEGNRLMEAVGCRGQVFPRLDKTLS